MSTKFVLNTKLHNVGLSWIIYSSKKNRYDIKENNHPDWLNKGPRYNTAKMLGLNYFIKIMKLDKNDHEAMKKFFKQIPTMKSKTLSHNKKYQLPLTDIGCVCYLTHLAAWDFFFVNQKTKLFFISEG